MKYDVTILTDWRYVAPKQRNDYIDNILLEDGLVREALEKNGLRVHRTNWDNSTFDWGTSQFALFRTTWDYFDRFDTFNGWLDRVNKQTHLINPYPMIRWNIDKSYLFELQGKGIPIPPSRFVPMGTLRTLQELVDESSWKEIILKPAIAGAARHTYRFFAEEADRYSDIFRTLIQQENLILQEYQTLITQRGEITLVLFEGRYSHAILKKARPGDFRVQDDFGGTVHPYEPGPDAIDLAQQAFRACPSVPVYGRVDMMWDNRGELCVSELELIEPELWFRVNPESPEKMARAVLSHMEKTLEKGRAMG
jgi:glutathione synthase/RimK-type ligase-like ATP-grasp enzyme